MNEVIVIFEYDSPTKNMYVYQEVPTLRAGEQPLGTIIGTLCIQKFILGDKPPTQLTVTIVPKE